VAVQYRSTSLSARFTTSSGAAAEDAAAEEVAAPEGDPAGPVHPASATNATVAAASDFVVRCPIM
jgi:hypothetical protein